MDDLYYKALAATQSIRQSPGFHSLNWQERAELDHHLGRVEAVLKGQRPTSFGSNYGAYPGTAVNPDPYAVPIDTGMPHSYPLATPSDLRGPGVFPGTTTAPGTTQQRRTQTPDNGTQRPPTRPAGTEVLGERARRALDAVDFPSFVAELIQGTFQAIVDATAQQVREYATLVADISRSVDDFTRDNVSINQARDALVEKHPRDLMLVLPRPGENTQPQVIPREDAEESPAWMDSYGLEGEQLTAELVEGPLLEASRKVLAEDRLRTLATMVLMGVNRIVVDDGQLRARLQFHAKAREKVSADIVSQTGAQQTGIAARQSSGRSAVSTMVSTVDVNAQADVSIKTELVGEVALRFRTETFDLNNFADAPTINLINRHSLTRENVAAGTSAPATTTPTPVTQIPETQTPAPTEEPKP